MLLDIGWFTVSANALLVNLYRNVLAKHTVCRYLARLTRTCMFDFERQCFVRENFYQKCCKSCCLKEIQFVSLAKAIFASIVVIIAWHVRRAVRSYSEVLEKRTYAWCFLDKSLQTSTETRLKALCTPSLCKASHFYCSPERQRHQATSSNNDSSGRVCTGFQRAEQR